MNYLLYPDDGVIEIGELEIHIVIDTEKLVIFILNAWHTHPGFAEGLSGSDTSPLGWEGLTG